MSLTELTPAEDHPPTADSAAAMMLAQAWMRVEGRRKAQRLVAELATLIETSERVLKLMPARVREAEAPLIATQREGTAIARQMLPVLIASIPRKAI